MTTDELFKVANAATKAARRSTFEGGLADQEMGEIEALYGERGGMAFVAAYTFYCHYTRYLKTQATLRDVYVLAKERAVEALRLDMDKGETAR